MRAATPYTTDVNSVVIIGANGSGKSKLGAWIEKQKPNEVHRIGGQRSLNFNKNIPIQPLETAENKVFSGTQKCSRWSDFIRDRVIAFSTTKLLTDFNDVLSVLCAKTRANHAEYFAACKEAKNLNRQKPSVPTTAVDKLINIWNSIIPNRRLSIKNEQIFAEPKKNGAKEEKYPANQMSDGERSVLYLAAQVLCVPENKTLIIDEPEIHLHRSLMNPLWRALEKVRPDCLFVYITHDTQFAAAHGLSDKIWVKGFDGQNWDLEKLDKSGDLPEDLLLDILGNRKSVLFVEGEKDSNDARLYSILYPDYYVIPCGGCERVILMTKAFRGNRNLHHLKAFGIIDRDFRSEHEINKYKEDGIYVLEVAEVENLFIAEKVIKIFAEEYRRLDPDKVFNEVKEYVSERFEKQLKQQISASVIHEIKFKLSTASVNGKDDSQIQNCVDQLSKDIDFKRIFPEKTKLYEDALASKDYKRILKLFNDKSLVKCIGRCFGLADNAYCADILRFCENDDDLIKAFKSYLPPEIPENSEDAED